MRMFVNQISNLVDVALRENPPLIDEQDIRRSSPRFREGYGSKRSRSLPDLDHSLIRRMVLRRADWIHSRERFVQNQQIGIVRQSLRQLRRAGACLCCTHRSSCLLRRQGRPSRVLGSRAQRPSVPSKPLSRRRARDPLRAGHAVVEGVLFRAEANPKVETGVAPNRFA